MKYLVSYKTKFGTISAESDYPDDLVVGYQTLKQLASKLERSNGEMNREVRTIRSKKISPFSKRRIARSQRGRGETTNMLRELEERILPTGFFSRPKTTGETKERLDATCRKRFTSRKVSQALGILWKRGDLRRTGSRNYYVYSK